MRVTAAHYGRYSSDQQRDASLDDQLRDCIALCDRLDLLAPVLYQDAEISGERRDRPSYLRLLRDAEHRRFAVLVLWDLKRLSRSEDLPQVLARFRFWGVRVVTCDGFDSSQEGSDFRGWIDGMMGNRFLRDLAKATHRGLTGRALAGASAGGLPYGYRVTETGHRAIDEAQAAVVRRIVGEYLAGQSPRAIAAALNRDGILSPARKSWAKGTILGDVKRGIGILANPIYGGRQVWNRSRWVKHPETGRRVRQERPQADWITSEHPELAILDAATWAALQVRLHGRKANAGRPERHLLSGLLRCPACGGGLGALDAWAYGCMSAKNGRGCTSRMRVPMKRTEATLLASVQARLLSDEAFALFQREVAAALKRQAPAEDGAKRRLQHAERERTNLMDAIKAGIRTPSTLEALQAAEAAVVTASAEVRAQAQARPAVMLPRAREVWKGMVDTLANAARNKPQARVALRVLLGEVIVKTENGALFAEVAPSRITMVAGARFGLYLREPLCIPLGRASYGPGLNRATGGGNAYGQVVT